MLAQWASVQASLPLTILLTRWARSGPEQAKCEICLHKEQAGIQVFNEPYNMKFISYPNCFESHGGDEAFLTHFSSQKIL